jgi:hypothetical protein
MRYPGPYIAIIFALGILCPMPAGAQSAKPTSLFVFGGTGSITPGDVYTYWKGPTRSLGGGVERRFATHVLLQGQLEILQRPKSPGEQTTVMPSANIGVEAGHERIRPFVSGGYTFVRSSAAFNFGGGVNIWLHERVGVRIEFRDHRFIFDEPLDAYGWRVGVAFR